MIRFYAFIIPLIFSNIAFANINAEIFKTPNNIEIILLQDKTTDLISINLAFKDAGAIADEPGKEGLSNTLMKILFRSDTGGMDRHQRARKIRELGILNDINYEVNNDDIGVYFKCPKENLQAAFEVLATILFKTDLNNTELNKLKAYGATNAQLATADEQAFAWNVLKANLFQGHPYATPAYGTQQGIQSINLQDIKQALTQRLAKDNLIISVVGNIEREALSKLVDQVFDKLPKNAVLPTSASPNPKLDGEIKTIVKDLPQSVVIFAGQSVSLDHKDFYALLALNRILGGEAFTSRLWNEIREKRGLVYGIRTDISSNLRKANIMKGSLKCENANTMQVINIIKSGRLRRQLLANQRQLKLSFT